MQKPEHIDQPAPFPAELTGRPQWLVWRFVTKPGQKKPAKMPYYVNGHLRGWPMGKPRDGKPTDSQPQVEQGHEWDREALATYDTAVIAAEAGRYDGVGFAFLPGDGLIGIDLDAACTDKHADIRDACGTFAEASPSGTGLHIIGRGTVETFKSNDVGIEVFCGRQFFTMTGRHDAASPFEIRDIPVPTLEKLRRTVDKAKEAARAAKQAEQPQHQTAPVQTRQPASALALRYCHQALHSAVQRVSTQGEGGRNDALNHEAYGLGQLLHLGVLSETTITAELMAAAASCGLPPGEALATIRSGLRAGQENPRHLTERDRRITPQSGNPAQPLASAITPENVDPDTGEILDAPVAANDNAPPSEFGQPIDLFGIQPPPELQLDMLPEPLVAYVRDQADLTGCDPAIIGVCALVASAACITDGIRLQPKRHDPTWTESARLWAAVVGDPSTKKSPAISKAVRHVKSLDHRMAEENASAMADWRWQHDQWKEAKKADKANPPPEPEEPKKKRLMVEDITVESLVDVLKDNPRGVLTLKDELTGWFASMDAYKGSTKGASMDRAHWLESYNGGRRSIDRVVRGSVIVPNWSTCVIGGIQPDMIRRVASSMGNDGLLQRFMIVCARPAVIDEDRTPDMRAMDDFSALFDQLVGLQPANDPVTLTEAAHRSREKVARYAKRLIDAIDHPHLQAWLGKWDGLYARLLLLYHVIDCASRHVYPTSEQVDAETADQVERLMCGFLLHHAIHFYTEIIDANERQEHVRQLARLILAKGFTKLTKRDIAQSWKASRRMEWWELKAVVDALCVHDWLAPDETDVGSDGKPRSWWVNQAVHAMFGDQAERERSRRTAATAALRELKEVYSDASQ